MSTPRTPLVKRIVRGDPRLYSMTSRARMLYTRRVRAAQERDGFASRPELFRMDEVESRACQELRDRGFTTVPDYVSKDTVDALFEEADRRFRALALDEMHSYSVRTGVRAGFDGLSYDEIASQEKMISLKEPLLHVPGLVDVALDERLFRIVANFLEMVPPRFNAEVVRDFPLDRPRESSNFHRDSDERDSVQAFVYLVDIDDRRGPLVYVPGSHRHDVRSCRPRLSSDLGVEGFDGRVSDEEVARHYPEDTWATVRVPRGTLAIIHGNGFHKGPAWPRYGDPSNLPRTAIKLNFRGWDIRRRKPSRNAVPRADFERLSELQKLVGHVVPA